MDMDMSIAALSVGMHQGQAQRDMGVSVLKMALQDVSQGVTDILPQASGSLDQNLGTNLDILA